MTAIEMRRKTKTETLDLPVSHWENTGLLFDRRLPAWERDDNERGEIFGKFIQAVCESGVPEIYGLAYQRWLAAVSEEDRFARWFGQTDGRLFLGLGLPHVLEAQVTRNRTYGIPVIPGSALKGLARGWAGKYGGLDKDAIEVLFGAAGDEPETAESGYLIFHDAWWVPGSKQFPYVREIVTVHHQAYYQGGEEEATDFDSPNPNHQIAVHGTFLFVIEGAKAWADLGLDILKRGLQERGIGAKGAAGYGYFLEKEDENALNDFKEVQKKHLIRKEARAEAVRIKGLSQEQRKLEELGKSIAQMTQKPHMEQSEVNALNGTINKRLDEAKTWGVPLREELVTLVRNWYDHSGWHQRGANKNQKIKQREKKESRLAALMQHTTEENKS
ncbi:MAG: hypothetical protein Kow0060_19110 [Methylohalobius crimeensis]